MPDHFVVSFPHLGGQKSEGVSCSHINIVLLVSFRLVCSWIHVYPATNLGLLVIALPRCCIGSLQLIHSFFNKEASSGRHLVVEVDFIADRQQPPFGKALKGPENSHLLRSSFPGQLIKINLDFGFVLLKGIHTYNFQVKPLVEARLDPDKHSSINRQASLKKEEPPPLPVSLAGCVFHWFRRTFEGQRE